MSTAKTELKPGKVMPAGCNRWTENGVWFFASVVDPERFGEHVFDRREEIPPTWDCSCGCWIDEKGRSGGPVHPYGACPERPKA